MPLGLELYFLSLQVQKNSHLGQTGLIEIHNRSKPWILSLSPNISGAPENPPDYVAMANEELCRSVKGTCLDSLPPSSLFTCETLKTLASLLEWRTMISRIFDEEEEVIVTASNLAILSLEKPQTVDEIVKLMPSAPEGVVNREPAGKPRQEPVIMRIIETNGSHMDELRELECHNCLKKGHGAAWACPLRKNNENLKIFMNRPENRRYKVKQNERRRKNWELNKKGGRPLH